MTNKTIKKEKRKIFFIPDTAMPFIAAILFLLTLCFSKEISESIVDGVRLAAFSIIPSIFPFFILTDIMKSINYKTDKGILSRAFELCFGINSSALPAFLCGNICGFPIGVNYASNLYIDNCISKDECERLIGISTNPSMAFVISGIGAGLLGNIRDGIVLYGSVTAATIITGTIFRFKDKSCKTYKNIGQKIDLVTSIKNAAHTSITVSSYIIFFSGVIGFLSAIINNKAVSSFISIFLEVANATKNISKLVFIPYTLKISIISFALAFSGFSAHVQAKSILNKDLSMSLYYKMKFCEGAVSFVITFLIYLLI